MKRKTKLKLKMFPFSMQEQCFCGKESTLFWLGKGAVCDDCFSVEYKKINKDEPEERQEKIKGNFEKRV